MWRSRACDARANRHRPGGRHYRCQQPAAEHHPEHLGPADRRSARGRAGDRAGRRRDVRRGKRRHRQHARADRLHRRRGVRRLGQCGSVTGRHHRDGQPVCEPRHLALPTIPGRKGSQLFPVKRPQRASDVRHRFDRPKRRPDDRSHGGRRQPGNRAHQLRPRLGDRQRHRTGHRNGHRDAQCDGRRRHRRSQRCHPGYDHKSLHPGEQRARGLSATGHAAGDDADLGKCHSDGHDQSGPGRASGNDPRPLHGNRRRPHLVSLQSPGVADGVRRLPHRAARQRGGHLRCGRF